MLITENYRELNRELHNRVPTYGTGGHKWSGYIATLAESLNARSILDYGCGKGTLAQAMRDMDVREYDPAIEGKDAAPDKADVVACLDVLEHVEPECLDAVLAHIIVLANKAAVFDVACRESGKKLADGRGAHINVQPAEWWEERLGMLGPLRRLPAPEGEFAAVVYKD